MWSKIVYLLVCLTAIVQAQSSGESYDDVSVEDTNQQEQAVLPLRITKQPQSQIAIPGSKVVFKCDYESSQSLGYDSSSIRIRWLFNLKPILVKSEQRDDTDLSLNGLNYVINNQYSVDKNKLVIVSYDPQVHSGQYRCLVNNTLFSPPLVVLSEPANLSLASKYTAGVLWSWFIQLANMAGSLAFQVLTTSIRPEETSRSSST